jgi:hypothetical protein
LAALAALLDYRRRVRSSPGPRLVAAFLLGVLLAQAAWILAVPPFRGMDEFDHVIRAAGVASGQWRLDEPAAGGRGLLAEVPADLVAASEGQCRSLPYIEPETCDGDGPGQEGTVRATTSAANYQPVYYWVVGTAGESFSGAGALYAMRAAAALMCAVVLALAAWCLTQWVRGGWTYVGLLVGLTPTLLYTTTVVAPNGLEMAAGVCFWAALMGLGSKSAGVRVERRLLVAAIAALVLLAGLRALGPLLILLIVASVVALRGWRPLLAVALNHRALVAVGMALGGMTTLAVHLWARGNVAVPDGALNGEVDSSWTQATRWVNWILSSIGAFPYRDQPAPLVVHVLVLLVLLTLLTVAVRRGDRTGRRAVLLASVLSLLVPTVLVALTLEERGGIYQGRYLLPFTAGVVVLAGAVADRAGWRPVAVDARPHLLAGLMLCAAHVVSVVHVQVAERARPVSALDPGWVNPPVLVTAALMCLAWLAFVMVVRRAGHAIADEAKSGEPVAAES